MPYSDSIVNLPYFTIKKVTGHNPIYLDVVYKKKPSCIHCNSRKLRLKDKFERQIDHDMIGFRKIVLNLEVRKFRCLKCHKYFREALNGINKWQRSSETFKKNVFHYHKDGISKKTLASRFGVSDNKISRYYDHIYDLEYRELNSNYCPEILGIDEHLFNKKSRYATTFCDLRRNKVFNVVKGRSEKDLSVFLEKLEGRDRVKVVCIDLCDSYRSIIRKYFPNAIIVTDRFHVVKLVIYHLISSCIKLDKNLKKERGIIKLLRTNHKNLKESGKRKLLKYLKNNPAVSAIYDFKEHLVGLLNKKTQTAKQCKELIPQFLDAINKLEEVKIEGCQKLAKTLNYWKAHIVPMWRFSKTNGITEGYHRRMKLIQRLAYGFKNFENYRKRVLVLCS